MPEEVEEQQAIEVYDSVTVIAVESESLLFQMQFERFQFVITGSMIGSRLTRIVVGTRANEEIDEFDTFQFEIIRKGNAPISYAEPRTIPVDRSFRLGHRGEYVFSDIINPDAGSATYYIVYAGFIVAKITPGLNEAGREVFLVESLV